MQIESTRQRGLEWGPEQAAGEPDTLAPGDRVTAWASLAADAGTEWLLLHYDKPVIPRELQVYENDAPGANTGNASYNSRPIPNRCAP